MTDDLSARERPTDWAEIKPANWLSGPPATEPDSTEDLIGELRSILKDVFNLTLVDPERLTPDQRRGLARGANDGADQALKVLRKIERRIAGRDKHTRKDDR